MSKPTFGGRERKKGKKKREGRRGPIVSSSLRFILALYRTVNTKEKGGEKKGKGKKKKGEGEEDNGGRGRAIRSCGSIVPLLFWGWASAIREKGKKKEKKKKKRGGKGA